MSPPTCRQPSSTPCSRCYRLVEELDLPPDLPMAVTRHISDVMFGYIEWITLYVFQAYENECRRWLGAEGNVLSSTIHRSLDSPEPDAQVFERETGYRLGRRHVAVILWSHDDPIELSILDRAARDRAGRLRSKGPPMITAIDRSTVWPWIARDLESTGAWVREVLGGLADDTPSAAVLRETLAAFFATKDSYLHTAERMNLHRNTVKYRVNKALAETPAHRDRVDLALALAVCEFLGSTVLTSGL